MTKINGSYRTQVPVQAEPYPKALRAELAALARAGGTVDHIEDLGFHQYRIHYVIPEQHTTVVDCGTALEGMRATRENLRVGARVRDLSSRSRGDGTVVVIDDHSRWPVEVLFDNDPAHILEQGVTFPRSFDELEVL